MAKGKAMAKEADANHQNQRNRQERAVQEKAKEGEREGAKEAVVRADSSTSMKKCMPTKKPMEEEGRKERKAQTIIRM